MQSNIYILMNNLTTNQITFLKDVPSDIKVDKTSSWRYNYLDGSIEELSTFIKLIGDNKIYLLIPLFASSKSLKMPHWIYLNLF